MRRLLTTKNYKYNYNMKNSIYEKIKKIGDENL